VNLSSCQLSNWMTFSPKCTNWIMLLSQSSITPLRESWHSTNWFFGNGSRLVKLLRLLCIYLILWLNIWTHYFKWLFSSWSWALMTCRSFNLLFSLHMLGMEGSIICITIKDSLLWYLIVHKWGTYIPPTSPTQIHYRIVIYSMLLELCRYHFYLYDSKLMFSI